MKNTKEGGIFRYDMNTHTKCLYIKRRKKIEWT